MKITVIGAAGSVGAPAVFYLAAKGLAHEILMIGGTKQNVLEQHVMDISTAVSAKDVVIRAGDFSDMAGTDIVINAAGAPQGLIADRMEMLPKNIGLVKQIAAQVKQYCPDAFVITATNPVDPLNYAMHRAGGFHRRKLIGYSINDSFRFRELLASAYGVKVSRVDGLVIGEHGSTQVLLFSTAAIDGARIIVDETIKENIRSEIPKIFQRYEQLQSGRTAGWTCAVGLEIIIRAIVENSGAVIPCSVVLDGEYGLKGLSMSVPARLGKEGVIEILEYELAADEQAGLKKSAETLTSAARIVDRNIFKDR
jgi:malate/lactate dehydrogenase